jgi:RNA polymerase sigma-70 factor (ECF subfamily)
MQGRSAGFDDTRTSFHREIMPELDAAYNFARYLSRDADAAQDIVQEAFLRAYRGFHGYEGPRARPWLFAIVRNCYREWLASRGRRTQVEVSAHQPQNSGEFYIDDFPSEEDSPEAALVRKTETNAVARVINALPRPFREVLVLRELEGLSYGQIAEVVMLPIGTVMSRLARARKKFAEAWRQHAQSHSPACFPVRKVNQRLKIRSRGSSATTMLGFDIPRSAHLRE